MPCPRRVTPSGLCEKAGSGDEEAVRGPGQGGATVPVGLAKASSGSDTPLVAATQRFGQTPPFTTPSSLDTAL